MTADAKIGLLLAFVFVVAITFVINGLPDFLSKDEPEQVEKYINSYRPGNPGVVGTSRAVVRKNSALSQGAAVASAANNTLNPRIVNSSTPRYSQVLPQAKAIVETTKPGNTSQTTIVKIQKAVDQIKIAPAQISSASQSQYYTVAEGDSLASIAKKFYGSVAGNKLANIEKIFKANRSLLKTPDKISVGQKLIIPPLTDMQASRLSSRALKTVNRTAPSQGYRQYIVKENDSLWGIAEKKLGSGSRYLEILKINKSVIADSDNLAVGTKLNIPVE